MILKVCKMCVMLCAMALFTGAVVGQEDLSGAQDGTEQVSPPADETQAAPPAAEETSAQPAATDSVKAPVEDAKGTIEELEKQVVIGYGSAKKDDLTGAVTTIEKSDLNRSSGFSIESALQGKASGVMVTQNSGAPGSQSMVRIRGFGTVNNSSPLYVIDGVSIRGGDISFLNPNDIESMSVLKDASSAAIYGTRGLNGVILITTKKAKDVMGDEKVIGLAYNGYYGISSPWKAPDLCNAEEWKQLKVEALRNSADTTGLGTAMAINGAQSTDWWKEVTRENAPTQRHDVSFMSSTDRIKFYMSGSYSGQEGLIKTSSASKMALHMNCENAATDWLKVGFNTTINNNKSHPIIETDENGSVLTNVYNATPPSPVRAGPKDTLSPDQFNNRLNSVGVYEYNLTDNNQNRILADVHATVNIAELITYNSSVSVDLSYLDNAFFQPKFFISNQAGNNASQSTVRRTMTKDMSWLIENTATLNKDIGDLNNIKFMVGVTAENNDRDSVRATGYNTPGNDETQRYLSSTLSTAPSVSGSLTSNSMLSFLGRLSYDFASRYLLTLSFRRDGSSRFGPDNRWGNFPSAALAWKISEEKFMENVTFIQLLKLRGGYGVLGNQEFGDFSYLTSTTPGQNYVTGKSQGVVPGATFLSVGNPKLKWEEQSSLNVGLDLALLDGAIDFSGDWFKKNTKDMLLQSPLAAIYGLQNLPWTNGGEIQNTGIDLAAGANHKFGDLGTRLSANFSTYKNEVIALSKSNGKDESIRSGAFRSRTIGKTAVGHPVGEFFGYKTNGLFQTQDEVDKFVDKNGNKVQPNAKPGDVRYMDADGDGKWDQDYIGSPHPDFVYGGGIDLNHAGNYGALDFRVFIQGSQGNDIFNATRTFTNTSTSYFNQERRMLDHWTTTNPTADASQPRMRADDADNTDKISDIYVEDGSYMRIKEAQIGYSLPKTLLSNRTIRIYVGARNLFTFTKYTGLDPEIGIGSYQTPLDIGIDRGAYPQARMLYAGIDVSL
jgi:TonB-linked SusC/RagA family outer membrane protein